MSRYCPVFIIELAAAMASEKFIDSTLPLEVFSNKLASHLSNHYFEIPTEMINSVAESYVRVLVVSAVDDAKPLLQNYIYNRIHHRRRGKLRNWNSGFSNPAKGTKQLDFDYSLARRNFNAFVYAYKNRSVNFTPRGWNLTKFEHLGFVSKMGEIEFSAFDLLS